MTSDAPTPFLVIVGNGPGEVAGWAVPIAAEARRVARERGLTVRTGLCLPPCQFASGQEFAAAAATGVFDHIENSRDTLRICVGLPGWAPPGPAVLLHVGGGFWYTRRLARRWRAPAFAFVERAHVARSHGAFDRIFVPTRTLRDRLLRYGVPGEKVVITGDPRHDAALMRHAGAHPVAGSGAHPRVTFLAGSRDSVFSAVFPFWVQTACALRARLPEARLVAVISPFVSPSVHRSLVARHRAMLDAARVELGYGGWPQVEGSDLVLTIPGSNTMELAVLRIPSMVVLPSSLAPQIPAEGLIEWVTRVPYAGPALRLYLARRYVQRLPYVALPNMRAGRRIMPELKGAVTPEQVAEESARLIRDEGARMAMVEALEEIPVETGASRRILEAMVSLWSGG